MYTIRQVDKKQQVPGMIRMQYTYDMYSYQSGLLIMDDLALHETEVGVMEAAAYRVRVEKKSKRFGLQSTTVSLRFFLYGLFLWPGARF